jgi:putative phage-type endonuclease
VSEQMPIIEAAHPYIDTGIRSDGDRAAWLGARRTGIGASEAAAVVGESRWADAGTVYARKIGALDEDDTHERLEWGLRHEPTILSAYASERYAGRAVRADRRLLRSSAHGWALATLDAWCLHPVHGWIPLELKTTESRHADEWIDGAPMEHRWQTHQQMLVTGAPCASIACLLGPHRLVWDDIERDETMIRRLVRAGAELWDRIERRDRPETRDMRALAALYPADDGSTIDLPSELTALDLRRAELAEQRKAIESEIERIDSAIKNALGPATRGVLPSGAAWSWKTVHYAERVQPARDVRVLRRHAAPHEKATRH